VVEYIIVIVFEEPIDDFEVVAKLADLMVE